MNPDELQQRFYEALVDDFGPVSLTGALSAIAPMILAARGKERVRKVPWGRLAEILSRALEARGLDSISENTLRGMARRLPRGAQTLPDVPSAAKVGMKPVTTLSAPPAGNVLVRTDRSNEWQAVKSNPAEADAAEDPGDRIVRLLDNLKKAERSRR